MTKKSKGEPQLPIKQLTILAICRFAEPIALTSVLPYLPEMVESFKVPKNEVAKWAGVATAIFSLCQCVTGIPWGRASDRFGRKPIILIGLTNTMVTFFLWGFSTSLPMAIAARALGGAGNGNVGIIRTMVAEMVPWKELQPRAFSIMPLVWNIGSIFGPTLGGALANPLRIKPEERGNGSFLMKYPYAIPNILGAILFFIGIIIGILFLDETLEAKRGQRDYGRLLGKKIQRASQTYVVRIKNLWHGWKGEETEPLLKDSPYASSTTVDEEAPEVDSKHPKDTVVPSYREVLSYQSVLNLIVYTLLSLHSIAFDQLVPIFLHHPKQDLDDPDVKVPFKFAGGFGMNSARIGLFFTLYGVSGMLTQFFVFPVLARNLGVLKCLKIAAPIFPVCYFLMPFTALLPNDSARQAVMFVIMLVKGWASIFAFPCTTILLTNSANSLSVLGTLNGVATSTAAIGRAMGPAVGGSSFSLGVQKGYIILPWWIVSAIAVISAVPIWFLVEGEGFGGDDDSDDEDGGEDVEAAVGGAEEGDERDDGGSPAPLLRRGSSRRGSTHRRPDLADRFATTLSRTSSNAASTAPGSDAEADEEPISTSAPIVRPGFGRRARRMSSVPVGMGKGISRRLSSNLGQSNSGFGTGGSYGA